jgi:hypothetical protein
LYAAGPACQRNRATAGDIALEHPTERATQITEGVTRAGLAEMREGIERDVGKFRELLGRLDPSLALEPVGTASRQRAEKGQVRA